jgi:hypothetical protein
VIQECGLADAGTARDHHYLRLLRNLYRGLLAVNVGRKLHRFGVRHLAFELNALGTVSGRGFRPPKAQLPGQFPRPQLSGHLVLASDLILVRIIMLAMNN